jgi:hypothetical protein
MMGWEWHLRTSAIIGLLFIPRVNVSGVQWWWWYRLVITPDLYTKARWQSYQQRHLEQVGRMDEGMRILFIQHLWYVNVSFTCRKILRAQSVYLNRLLQEVFSYNNRPITYCCVLQQWSTLTGSTVQDVIFTIPHFAKALLRNISQRYVFVKKRCASMKFRDRNKFRYGIPTYPGQFRLLTTRRADATYLISKMHFSKFTADRSP